MLINSELRIFRVMPLAIYPIYGTSRAIDLDIYSARDKVIPPFSNYMCATDLSVQVPEGCYGSIASRSGLAIQRIIAQAGIIAPDYTSNLFVLLYNFLQFNYRVRRGD